MNVYANFKQNLEHFEIKLVFSVPVILGAAFAIDLIFGVAIAAPAE